jgi:predicted nucleic acid-binding protein
VNVYVDTSAFVAVLAPDERRYPLYREADAVFSSRVLVAEAWAALARAERDGRLTLGRRLGVVRRRLAELGFVELTAGLADEAGRLARRHALRGYDAVHLASALALRDDALVVATWDDELAAAAEASGLAVAGAIPPRA